MARKNPAAVALGRLGGKVGGRKGFAAMDRELQKRLARAGARARWAKHKKNAKQ